MGPEEFTPEQKENLETWTEQRDSILSAVSVLIVERDKLRKENRDLAFSITDTETRMNEVRGRIEELKIKESELSLVVSKEVASLQSRKNTLESEISSLSKIVEILTTQKTLLEADVSFALSALNVVKDETFSLDKVVDRVTSVSNDNARKIDLLVEELGRSLAQLIKVNKKNVDETNIVIEKLPAMIMEAQKHGLIKNKI